MFKTFVAVIARDCKIGMRNRSEILMPLAFFLIITSLFPLGLGLENRALLKSSAPAILWVAALLSTILVLDRLFKNDFDDGSLEQMAISGQPLYLIILGKIVAHWLLTGLPLILFSPILALMLYFNFIESLFVAWILFLGTPLLSLVGAMCVALVVGLRQAGLLLSIIILPLYIPVLLVGVQMISRLQEGHSLEGLTYLMLAGNVAALVICPLIAAFSVKLSLD